MVRHHRPPREGQGTLQQSPGLGGVALREPDLGQSLQAVRLACRGVRVVVQLDRLGQLALGPLEVALQHRRLADQGARERHTSERPGAVRLRQQLLGVVDHLVVRDRAVQQVLRDAQVRVEQSRDEPLPASGASELVPEALEPLTARVGDQALQREQVDERHRVVWGPQQGTALVRDLPRPFDVAGEEREVALRDQDRAVGSVTLGLQSGQRLDADLHLACQGRRPREPGPDQAMLGAGRDRHSLEVRRHGVGVAQGLEQVAAASQQPREILG